MAGRLRDDKAWIALAAHGIHCKHRFTFSHGTYFYNASTSAEDRTLTIYVRSHKPRHRYWVGLNTRLLQEESVVDLLVFWFRAEPLFFVIPAPFMASIFRKIQSPSVNKKSGQWYGDISVSTQTFETAGLDGKVSLAAFAKACDPV